MLGIAKSGKLPEIDAMSPTVLVSKLKAMAMAEPAIIATKVDGMAVVSLGKK